jgi:hypothetical protein
VEVTIRAYDRRDAAGLADVFFRSVRQVALSDYTAAQVRAWAPEPRTAEQITLGPDGQPVLQTFTVTEGPLCPSGTYVNTNAITPSPDQAHTFIINTRSVFTCDDGSGTFNVMTQARGTAVTDDFATTTGTTQLLGGTGAYANLTGHGSGTGSIDFAAGTATATIVGVVVRG